MKAFSEKNFKEFMATLNPNMDSSYASEQDWAADLLANFNRWRAGEDKIELPVKILGGLDIVDARGRKVAVAATPALATAMAQNLNDAYLPDEV